MRARRSTRHDDDHAPSATAPARTRTKVRVATIGLMAVVALAGAACSESTPGPEVESADAAIVSTTASSIPGSTIDASPLSLYSFPQPEAFSISPAEQAAGQAATGVKPILFLGDQGSWTTYLADQHLAAEDPTGSILFQGTATPQCFDKPPPAAVKAGLARFVAAPVAESQGRTDGDTLVDVSVLVFADEADAIAMMTFLSGGSTIATPDDETCADPPAAAVPSPSCEVPNCSILVAPDGTVEEAFSRDGNVVLHTKGMIDLTQASPMQAEGMLEWFYGRLLAGSEAGG